MYKFIYLFSFISILALLPFSMAWQYLLLVAVCFSMTNVLRHPLHFFILLSSGFLIFSFSYWQINKQNLPFIANADFPIHALVQGNITSIPQVSKIKTLFQLHLDKIYWQEKWHDISIDLPLSWYGDHATILLGQRWQFMLNLKPYHAFANPGEYSHKQSLWEQRRKLRGYIKKSEQNQLLSEPTSFILRWRQAIWHKLQQLPLDKQQQAFLSALAIGHQTQLSQQDWRVLRESGTAHLFAISGLHVGIVALLCFCLSNIISYVFPRSFLFISKQKINAVFAFIGLIVYGMIAGWGMPVQRAIIMLSVLLFVKYFLYRNINPWHLLNYSCMLILLFDPLAPLSAGFELSFFSVAILLFCFSGRIAQQSKIFTGLKVHVIMSLALLPLLIYYWQLLPLFSIAANVVAVPIVTLLIVPLILLACIVLPISNYLWLIAGKLLSFLWAFLEWLTHFSLATWQTNHLSLSQFLSFLLAVLLFFLPRGIPGRWLFSIFLMPLFIVSQSMLPDGSVKLIIFDIGQGLAIAIQTKRTVTIYDTGAKFDNFDMAEKVIIPYLKREGIKKIDTVILSHADNDHSGGFNSLKHTFPIDKIYVSDKKQLDSNSHYCLKGERWQKDKVDFQFIYPGKNYLNLHNNSSCVLRIAVGEHVVLLSGDIEAFVEKTLLENNVDIKADIFVVPHHGSLTSSTVSFVEQVKPKHAVFSVGYLNQFSHPEEKVVERYRRLGSKIWRTDQHGAIVFFIKPGAALADPVISRQR